MSANATTGNATADDATAGERTTSGATAGNATSGNTTTRNATSAQTTPGGTTIGRPPRAAAATRRHLDRPAPAAEPVPLAPGQQNLWEFVRGLSPADPGAAAFPVVDFRRIHGQLDRDALDAALRDVAVRHHILRASFAEVGDQPKLRFSESVDPPLEYFDLRDLDPDAQTRRIEQIAHRERFRPFDLQHGPLWQICLLRTGPATHLMTLSFFHVISDGWSNQVFVEDLLKAYAARVEGGDPPPPLDLSFADVVRLQRQQYGYAAADDEYWRENLSKVPASPAFTPRPVTAATDLTAEISQRFAFGQDAVRAARAVAWRHRTTPFTVALAAYAVYMCARTRRERIVVGTTTLGRDSAESRRIINQFTNNVYLNIGVGPADTLHSVVSRTHETMAEAVSHVSSFDRLARTVYPQFDANRPWPYVHLFDCWFQSAAPKVADLARAGLSVEQVAVGGEEGIGHGWRPEPLRPAAEIEIWAHRGLPGIILDDDRGGGVNVYNRDLYDTSLVQQHTAGFVTEFTRLVEEPDSPATAAVRQAAGDGILG